MSQILTTTKELEVVCFSCMYMSWIKESKFKGVCPNCGSDKIDTEKRQ